jgi:hypothetical protein
MTLTGSSGLAIVWALALGGCGAQGISESHPYEEPRAQALGMMSMTTARADHAAVALEDGRVLLTGGTATAEVGGVQSSAEIFDPRTYRFTPTGSMTVRRQGHTATRLEDGRILVAGGTENIGFRTELASAEIYDPKTGRFTATGSMSTAREGHAATLLPDGRVLITGGSDNGRATLSSAEIYEPASATFSPAGNMNVPREAHTSTLLRNGRVLIAGGGRGDMPGGYIAYDSAELYDPTTGTFASVAQRMTSDRVGLGAALLNDGRVLLVGGKSGRVLAGPPQGDLYYFTPLNSADVYDPETGSFTATGLMSASHYLPTVTPLGDGRVLVVGGWQMQGPIVVGMGDADLYAPSSNTFASAGRTHIARLEQTATLLPDGSVLIAGGIDGTSHVTSTVEFYAPASGTFEVRPPGAPPPSPPVAAAAD